MDGSRGCLPAGKTDSDDELEYEQNQDGQKDGKVKVGSFTFKRILQEDRSAHNVERSDEDRFHNSFDYGGQSRGNGGIGGVDLGPLGGQQYIEPQKYAASVIVPDNMGPARDLYQPSNEESSSRHIFMQEQFLGYSNYNSPRGSNERNVGAQFRGISSGWQDKRGYMETRWN